MVLALSSSWSPLFSEGERFYVDLWDTKHYFSKIDFYLIYYTTWILALYFRIFCRILNLCFRNLNTCGYVDFKIYIMHTIPTSYCPFGLCLRGGQQGGTRTTSCIWKWRSGQSQHGRRITWNHPNRNPWNHRITWPHWDHLALLNGWEKKQANQQQQHLSIMETRCSVQPSEQLPGKRRHLPRGAASRCGWSPTSSKCWDPKVRISGL